MAGLLYKEFIINRKNIIISGVGYLLLSALILAIIGVTLISNVELTDEYGNNIAKSLYTFLMMMASVVIFAASGSVQQMIFASDERKKWCDYISSTPVSVKGQVLSKYYFALLISIATLVYCTLFCGIGAVLNGEVSGLMNISVGIFTFQIFLRSVEIPFFIRFGYKNGNNYRLIIFGVACFALLVYCLFGDLSIFGSFDGFMKWFTKITAGQTFSDIMLLAISIMPFAVAILYYLSYRISCRLYLIGAENYDK